MCNKKESCGDIKNKAVWYSPSVAQDVENLNCSVRDQIKFPTGIRKLDPLNLHF